MSAAPAQPLVSVAWLRARMKEPGLRVVDCRWYLSGRRGEDEYAAGHLPGAVFADLERDLAAPRGEGPGRHPLPTPEAFARALARLGVDRETFVVAYDDAGGAVAARLWWLMRHHGLPRVAVLDGGIDAWLASGGELSREAPPLPKTAPLHLTARGGEVVDKRTVDALRSSPRAVLLDARARERFLGRTEPIDARPGHIPGARSAPYSDNLDPDTKRFRSAGELSVRYADLGALGAPTVVCYCGSGVTACHALLSLALVGRDDAQLYEGSYSDWSADAELPVATGEE